MKRLVLMLLTGVMFCNTTVFAKCFTMGCFNNPQLYAYIAKLQQQNKSQQQQIETLKHQVVSLQPSVTQHAVSVVDSWSKTLKALLSFDLTAMKDVWSIQSDVGGMSGFLILIAGLVFWCFLVWSTVGSELLQSFRNRPINKNVKQSNAGYDADEFDYLSSVEAVPAKLDLARAYLQMEDFDSARKVLKEIMGQGNVQQRDYANRLYEQIC